VNLWPVGMMALGGWMLAAVWRDRRRQRSVESEI
jgi:hypothetical protein